VRRYARLAATALLMVAVSGCSLSGTAGARSLYRSLPRGFVGYLTARRLLAPVIAHGTTVSVWFPLYQPQVSPTQGPRLDAQFAVHPDAYQVLLYWGPPQPVRPMARNLVPSSRWLVLLDTALHRDALVYPRTFGSVSPIVAEAGQGEIRLPHGLTATNFSGGSSRGPVTGVEWAEDGWTFIITPTLDRDGGVDRVAGELARRFWGFHLPNAEVTSAIDVEHGVPIAPSHGVAVFRMGGTDPSLVLFREHGDWYSVEAPHWDALNWARSMAATVPLQ